MGEKKELSCHPAQQVGLSRTHHPHFFGQLKSMIDPNTAKWVGLADVWIQKRFDFDLSEWAPFEFGNDYLDVDQPAGHKWRQNR